MRPDFQDAVAAERRADLQEAIALQREAMRKGWAAYRAGRPVLWVHGSPYEAPDYD